LLPRLDDAIRARIMELNDEVFGGRRDVFDARALDEVEEDPDALFLVLEVDGRIEAGVFGYFEEPIGSIVEDTDFFLDSAMVSAEWQSHGLGEVGGLGVLLLLALIEDVHRVGVAVWTDGDVERLVSLYKRFGFVDAVGHGMPPPCLKVTLDDDRVNMWEEALGLSSRATPTDG
jgi:GNAT superfamily N-acetyltransferase